MWQAILFAFPSRRKDQFSADKMRRVSTNHTHSAERNTGYFPIQLVINKTGRCP